VYAFIDYQQPKYISGNQRTVVYFIPQFYHGISVAMLCASLGSQMYWLFLFA